MTSISSPCTQTLTLTHGVLPPTRLLASVHPCPPRFAYAFWQGAPTTGARRFSSGKSTAIRLFLMLPADNPTAANCGARCNDNLKCLGFYRWTTKKGIVKCAGLSNLGASPSQYCAHVVCTRALAVAQHTLRGALPANARGRLLVPCAAHGTLDDARRAETSSRLPNPLRPGCRNGIRHTGGAGEPQLDQGRGQHNAH